MSVYVAVSLFAGAILVFSAFSSFLQRIGLPGPLLALAFGAALGPYALDVVTIGSFGVPPMTLLEEASRVTLAIGLSGVALRLPHGYWREHRRWVLWMIGVGMVVMLLVATGVLWALLGLPLALALLIGAIITPTDPVVTTPVVTGSLAEAKIPDRVRFNISSESGLNDGLAYLFVFLPIMLMIRPDKSWSDLLTTVVLREVIGGALFGVAVGLAFGYLYRLVRRRQLIEETAYLGFIIALAFFVLGTGEVAGVNALLAVFIAAAVFGQIIPQSDEQKQDRLDDSMNRFFILPVFMLLGLALPFPAWGELGWGAVAAVMLALVLRRVVTVWLLRPALRPEHSRAETAFLSWFAPVGVSALFYSTVAEHETGDPLVFTYATLAIAISVLIHGVSASPLSYQLHRYQERREPERAADPGED
ncbi:cation:proton antiporter [Demequina sp. SO4-13]|uniref:cation:proton antiporter domain-containing protein n=1 Tax=Demequina sp. SO4-13 TaxID=3401027 RepID=UPI003AF79EA1